MTLQSKLRRLSGALTSIENLRVYHYWRPKMEPPFCVWAEDGETAARWTGNHQGEQAVGGTVDYYTLREFDPDIDRIQEALNTLEGCGWRLESVQYEEDTNLIHYEWYWRLI